MKDRILDLLLGAWDVAKELLVLFLILYCLGAVQQAGGVPCVETDFNECER
jgi:hypothetical protein